MTRANPFAELANRDSALVKDALTRRCDVCKAKPDSDCTNTIGGGAIPGRVVHYVRVDPALVS